MTRKMHTTGKSSFISMLIMFLALIYTSNAMASATLSKIRVGQTNEKTRIVFDIKHNHYFKVRKLNNPSRIVVDFYKAKNDVSFKKMKFLDPRLSRIRLYSQKARTRVVLDLRKNYDFRYFTLAKNKFGAERVVVDITKRLPSVKPKTIAKKVSKPKPKIIAKAKPVIKKVAKPPVKKVAVKTSAKPKVVKVKLADAGSKKAVASVKHVKKFTKDIADEQSTRDVMNAGSSVFYPENKDLIVAIDPGHGGKDTGAIGVHGIYEKNVVLAMAKKLKKYIDAQPGMHAVLTRDRDVFIPLGKRVRLAHKMNADIFISIHADSFPDRSARGGSVYVLSTRGASSVMARILAKSENASLNDIKLKGRDSDVAFVLSDLSREANIRASRKLARTVLGSMGRSVTLHKRSVQAANFAVLKSIDMPSMLIETAFVSNPKEARKLKNSFFQDRMAKSIALGVTKFVRNNADEPRWGEKLYLHYRVQSGDTLSEIAANYKISTRTLKRINHIKKADRLYVGKKLRIPVSDSVVASL
ncbi:N-acetylmuramoyl-L-alanine amidase [Hydrogenovibrio kuenenii]|uniref:N-acetylmuramoyl-L-alanine amidase n=1 Tax=Hydrogenovibrio kuenenii TaxID=63658 RepID=UPI0004663830|nr:N-acetylmuramoyl-L-alanine amidase [Hydrogenovibrio kuenenii]